jgi:hypothetical protein
MYSLTSGTTNDLVVTSGTTLSPLSPLSTLTLSPLSTLTLSPLSNNMNKVQVNHVAIFKIERNDKNEITSAKFIKEMWIETKNGSSVDFEVAKDPEISKYKADEITIRAIYTITF